MGYLFSLLLVLGYTKTNVSYLFPAAYVGTIHASTRTIASEWRYQLPQEEQSKKANEAPDLQVMDVYGLCRSTMHAGRVACEWPDDREDCIGMRLCRDYGAGHLAVDPCSPVCDSRLRLFSMYLGR
jgi:hypothetical protein